jgi:predicted RND superfamily exporter protein
MIAEIGLRWPRRLLIVAAIGAALMGIYSAGTPINTARHTMVSADNPHQAKQIRFFDRFGLPNEMVMVVSGADVEQRHAIIDALSARLEQEEWLTDRVLAQIGSKRLAPLALLFDPTLPAKLPQLMAGGELPIAAKLPNDAGIDADGYLVSSDGAHHFIALLPDLPGLQGHEVKPFVEQIRAHRDEIVSGSSVEVRLTGPPALAVDEEGEIKRGILTTSGITGLGIVLLLMLAYRSWRYTLLALVPVAIGVCATMAVARAIYGELNMVTSSCSSMLLALGIDFGVFLLSRYGETVRDGASAKDAIRLAVTRAGKGLIIGAVTTATAFLTTSATEFTAYARLGVIVALGLLIMMGATLLFMPALLWVAGRGKQLEAPEIKGLRLLPRLIRNGRHWLLAGGAIVAVASLASVTSLSFNTRFYDFLPEHGESASALRLIERDRNVSPLHATIAAEGIEEARVVSEKLRALDVVASVQTPSDLLPPLDGARLEALNALKTMPAPDFEAMATAQPELALLAPAWKAAVAVAQRGSYLPSDLPPVFQQRYVSLDGKAVAITVVPKGDIWQPETARRFSEAVSEVAPEATGMAMHIYAHLRMIREGFTRAALASAALVLLILLIAFRKLSDALLAMVPTLVGFTWMLGAMSLLRFNFDAANIVTLPLIIGIGVDAGVHLVHRMRQSQADNDGVATLEDVAVGTGGAVALASVTTTVGFASLMLAEYGAMKSLGLAMTLGIGATLLASLLLLPSLMVVLGRAR